jgi:hypothetical protein
MPSGVEAVDGVAWANTQLLADSAFLAATPGGVHLGVAPQGTPAPVCVLFVQSAPEYLTAFGVHVWSDATLLVKISGPQDGFAAIRTAAMRAYAVLQRKSGSSFGSQVLACVLQSAVPLPESALVNGVQWMSYVQLYKLLIA